jgi:hypothetical protein
MEQSPWEADTRSASRKIPRLVWNPKDHYRVHNGQLLIPSRARRIQSNTLSHYFPKIHLNHPSIYAYVFRVIAGVHKLAVDLKGV